jgi:hypothetical protein
MATVFLSHSSTDKAIVRRLVRRIEAAGHNVWLDEEQLHVGDSLADNLGKSVTEADFVAVALSPRSVQSAWVREELNVALADQIEQGRVKVLPILVESCEIPPLLKNRVYADISSDWSFNEGVDRIIARLDFHDRHDGREPLTKPKLPKKVHRAPLRHSGSEESPTELLRSLVHQSLQLAALRAMIYSDILSVVDSEQFDSDVSSALRNAQAALVQVEDVRYRLAKLGPSSFSRHFDIYYRFVENLERRAAVLKGLATVKNAKASKKKIVRWAEDLKALTAECHGITRSLALALLEEGESLDSTDTSSAQ